jgi:nucleoside-diphosphate-sugar epimerase
VSPPRFTVFGGRGFVGGRLLERLSELGFACRLVGRDDDFRGDDLEHVLYAAGLTADFRHKRFDTMRAHAARVADVLEHGVLESFLYLSSTRVYRRTASADEASPLVVDPADPESLYDISKLAGESLCLSDPRPTVRVARLSNVYGTGDDSANFLPSLVRSALGEGRVRLRSALDSEKDYVAVTDVAQVLPEIAQRGAHRLYNVASGRNTTHAAIIEVLREHTGCEVEVAPAAPRTSFAPITITRVQSELGFRPRSVLEDLPALIEAAHSNNRRSRSR